MVDNKPNVFIICTGVGHINRGYESFTLECFDVLKTSSNFELFLLKGGGKTTQKELKIPCIKRSTKLASFLNKVSGKQKYWIEQVTFLIGMLPKLFKYKPAVIYYSDFILGTFLFHLRRFFKFKYKLLFSNGAPNGPPYKTEDHIQQLLPMYIKQAQTAGTSLDKQTLLPYAIKINLEVINSNIKNKPALLKQLLLPANKKIIICVGAVNSHHKRIDYLINEFAMMDNEDYFLIVLGQIDELSEPILQLANSKLLNNNYLIKQVNSSQVMSYLCVADYFILPSLKEGLPRVLPEAMSAGLLPIVHDYVVTRETLNDYGVFKDMTMKGILQEALDEVNQRNIGKEELINYALTHYSWQNLAARYEEMIVGNFS
jgi:1,2-diacylglycerol 3-alpha-glucosyltransferase